MPTTGFYEWKDGENGKTPYFARLKDEKLFAMAGLFDRWRAPSGEEVHSFTIITTTANDLLSEVHERMPVVIAPEDFALWLGEAGHGAARLMVPAPEEALVAERADAATREMLGRRAAPPPGLVALRG